MSYNPKGGHGYGNRPRRPQRTWVKKTVKKERFGLDYGKDTIKVEFNRPPSEFTQEEETSGSLDVTNGVLGVGGTLTKKKRNTTKFPES